MPPLKEDVRQQLDEAGIPVLQYWALHVDRILPMIDDFGVQGHGHIPAVFVRNRKLLRPKDRSFQ
ncbi:hypothetical protein [Methanothrix sp.]|uniref:hypothetical protein n=1 Tax=Methanothrix sp. TaxID=90426 RepID=UPI003BB78FA4